MQGLLLVSGRLGDVGTFAGSDLALLETFARHVATSLDRGRLETDLRRVIELQEELRHAAMHDPLTELPNRTLFLDRTQHDLHLAGPQRPVAGRPLHRPRRLQAGQRHLRPPGRRPAAQGVRAAAARSACAPPTPPPASAATSSRCCCTGRSTTRACRRRSTASAPSSTLDVDLGGGRTAKVGRQHRRRLLRSRHRHRRADPPRRPGDVHRQAQRPGHLGVLRPGARAASPRRPPSRRPADVQPRTQVPAPPCPGDVADPGERGRLDRGAVEQPRRRRAGARARATSRSPAPRAPTRGSCAPTSSRSTTRSCSSSAAPCWRWAGTTTR